MLNDSYLINRILIATILNTLQPMKVKVTLYKPWRHIQGVPGGMCQTLGECFLS